MDLLRRRAAGLLHKFTATVIHDFDWNEVKVVGQKYRRKARLVLVVLVLCAFLVAAVMLTFRQPSIRTDLKTGIDVTAKLSASITHGPTSSSNDSDLPFICPCSVPQGLGLRMSVNWTRYMELCKPSFCIVISHTTTRYRLLQALSQAGGMYAAIILVARIVVWPIFLWLYSLCSIKCQT